MAMAPETGVMERSVEDILAGRLRIRLAGEWHVLPVLTVGQNADWLATLEAEMDPLISGEDDLAKVVGLMDDLNGRLLDFVYSYDLMHVLPEQSTIARDVYPHEVLRAVMEVRLAANPTLGLALTSAIGDMKEMPSSVRTSSSRPRTAGRSRKSATN